MTDNPSAALLAGTSPLPVAVSYLLSPALAGLDGATPAPGTLCRLLADLTKANLVDDPSVAARLVSAFVRHQPHEPFVLPALQEALLRAADDDAARQALAPAVATLTTHMRSIRPIWVETYAEHGTLDSIAAAGLIQRLDAIRDDVGAGALPTWDVLGLQMSKEAHRARLFKLVVGLRAMDADARASQAAHVARFVGPALHRPRCEFVLLVALNALDLVSSVGALSSVPRSVTAAAIQERQDPWSSLVADMPALIKHVEYDHDEVRAAWKIGSHLKEQLHEVTQYAFELDAVMRDIDMGRPLTEEEEFTADWDHKGRLRKQTSDLQWVDALTRHKYCFS